MLSAAINVLVRRRSLSLRLGRKRMGRKHIQVWECKVHVISSGIAQALDALEW